MPVISKGKMYIKLWMVHGKISREINKYKEVKLADTDKYKSRADHSRKIICYFKVS